MKTYEGKDIRNAGVVGHGDSGKTTLTAGLLFTAGATSRLLRVDEGNTITDFDEEEVQRKVSISTAIAVAEDAASVAEAMKLAFEGGRLAYLGGRMPKKLYASASSPLAGGVGTWVLRCDPVPRVDFIAPRRTDDQGKMVRCQADRGPQVPASSLNSL